MNDAAEERTQIAQIYKGLSDEAKALIVEVLEIENASLHREEPEGIPDEILRRAEGHVK